MIRIGALELGDTPRIIAAIDDRISREAADAAVDAGVDILELRVDLFSTWAPGEVAEIARRFQGIPLVATVRSAAEGGRWNKSEPERLAVVQALLPHVDAVDIELMSKEILPEVVGLAHAAGKVVIGSHHNFESTPLPEKLAGITNDGKLLGVDIVKVAAYCQSMQDVRTLARFTSDHRAKQVVTVGMGPYGRLTRIFFPALGSLLTFTFLGQATAPGQLTCEETIQYVSHFYPDFRRPPAEESAG